MPVFSCHKQCLANTSPESVLSLIELDIIDAFNGMHAALKAITESVNSLPTIYASDFPALPRAVSVAYQCHSLMLQTYKLVLTTGTGDCMYYALSQVVCGSEQLSKIFRL